MLQFQQPQMKPSDIPNHDKLQKTILLKALEVEGSLQVLFKILLTFDAWTSLTYDLYLAVPA
ncbi:hypothetical protein SERLA73DRAFT_75578 [Serpula lacrymans var. lacrymans S7.3]|uniref:Uncharacterized protein n=2 Tax=Serpula lacrymans var. lacrymans TaxID=341189 RepID=F8Q579_SERL3|nr:uncharacterized protein SERLADRAFT_440341 [Serpula lacrymans var. lacrymans S7.9]EGN96706.1 hypothetical protein SERLA73DRAFT_75578 [Serpula lacrymans var. lacrymans S7.3]EGO22321.1 hypothetical protein SERLADRAFT_440341 [Serpula lacrymans var. lacrymans S7.9]